MQKRKQKTLIFDFDGTIADSVETMLSILNHIAHELGYRECKLTAHMLQTRKIPDLLNEFNIPVLKLPLLVAKIKKRLHRHVSEIPPIKHIEPVLAELKKQ